MNLRNLLKPGDFVFPVPVGIRTTLQYNASGNLEKVFVGYTEMRQDITSDVMQIILSNSTVPTCIHIKNGTSWVKGVLYTSSLMTDDGMLPHSVEKSLIKTFVSNPTQFNFFAHSICSTSTVFRGVTPVRQALTISRFKVLPGWIVPNKFDNTLISKWTNDSKYTFNPIVSDFVIYRGDSVQYMSNHLSQFVVQDIKQYVDDNGYIKSAIHKTDGSTLYVDYSDVVKYNVHPSSLVILDSDKQIFFTKSQSSKEREYKNTIVCPHCGKLYNVPDSGSVQCPDIHCTSRLLSSVMHFMSVMNLPKCDISVVRDWLKNEQITCIPDILILDDYKDLEIQTTIPQIIRSLISTAYIVTDEIFKRFVLACNSNQKTFKYYVTNPNRIASDLSIEHPDLNAFVDWLSDGYNASDLLTLVDSPQLKVTWVNKKFDGAPIFRGKTIYLTGDFIRGSVSEIGEILESYAANVVTQFSDIVNCVLIGSTHEGINGKDVNCARSLGVPVFEEDTFFYQYDIDYDISNIS